MRKTAFALLAVPPLFAGAITELPATVGGWPGSWVQERTQAVSDTIIVLLGQPVHPGVADLSMDLSIGGRSVAPEYSLTEVFAAEPRDDGGVYVIDVAGRSVTIREYDARGEYVREIGGLGEGPGEYTVPRGLALFADGRLAVWDYRGGRINLYSVAGESIDTWRFPVTRDECPQICGSRLRVDYAGYLNVHIMPTLRQTLEGQPPRVIRVSDGGAIVDTVTGPAFDYPTLVRVIDDNALPGNFSVPYTSHFVHAWSPFGYFVTAETDRYQIDIRASSDVVRRPAAIAEGGGVGTLTPPWQPGDTVVSLRRIVEPVEVTREERAERRDYLDWQSSFEVRRQGPLPEIPPVKPVIAGYAVVTMRFKELMIGSRGRIWVELSMPSVRYERDDTPERRTRSGEVIMQPPAWREPRVFDVLEPTGTYVGQVRVPDGLALVAVRGDIVWGVAEDEYDVPTLMRYHIDWPDLP